MKNKDKTLMIVLGIFALVIVTTAASFAFFSYSRTSNTKTTISTGDLQFSYFERKDSLSISNQFPLADSVGAKDEANAYDFQVGMNSSSANQKMNYNVILVSNNTGDKVFTHDQIKFSLTQDGTYVANTKIDKGRKLSTVSGLTAGTSTGEGVVLANQPINSGDVHNYKLRIWISDDVNYSSTPDENGTSTGAYNNYTYSLKVKITSAQYSVYTINGKITNQNGEAIANTTIAAHSSLQVTTTDREGNYTLEGLESGSHTLYVMDGYTEQEVRAMTDTEITENSKGTKEFNVTKSGTVNLTVEVTSSKVWSLREDNDNSENVSFGDLICYSTECFYVYSVNQTEIKALAQYNLYVGGTYNGRWKAYGSEATGLQDSNMKGWYLGVDLTHGVVAFSNSADWKDMSEIDIQKYDGPVKDAINNYKKVIKNASVRLITRSELDELGCNYDADYHFAECSESPKWVKSTTYWTSTGGGQIPDPIVPGNYVNAVFKVSPRGYETEMFDIESTSGVRPVITILASEFE